LEKVGNVGVNINNADEIKGVDQWQNVVQKCQ
jgi:hypothetical protein